jgi:hypothetical protein
MAEGMVKSEDKEAKNTEKRRRGGLEGNVSDLLRNRRTGNEG